MRSAPFTRVIFPTADRAAGPFIWFRLESADVPRHGILPFEDAALPFAQDVRIEIEQTLQRSEVVFQARQQARIQRTVNVLPEHEFLRLARSAAVASRARKCGAD
jgi:hypothetical protein